VSAWQDLVTAGLIGTERTGFPPPPAADLPGRAGAADIPVPDYPVPDSPVSDDPAAVLLDRAALVTAARRGGRLPERAEPLSPAGPDPVPAAGRAAARRLARLLGGEHPDLLAEWLAAAVARGRRAPEALLPALLDRARRFAAADPELRRLAVEAGGSRARWLAGLNPDWKFVIAVPPAGEDAWRRGNAGQRRAYLATLRARDPAAGRELVAASWDAAAPAERVMFVDALAAGLSLADEPLLEAALDDRADDVRSHAARMLTRLPGSALARRMAGRAVRCLRLEHSRGARRLVVRPPGEPAAAMRRDGIRSRPLPEVMAATPLRTWTEEFGLPAGRIVAIAASDWGSALVPMVLAGWSQAAITQDDQEWMAALIGAAFTSRAPDSPAEATALRQLARRASPALGAPGALPAPERGAPASVHDAAAVLRFRYEMLKELDDDDSAG
jgi:Family of unknown function (DUF5691)